MDMGGEMGVMMAEIAHTRLSRSGWGAGWKRNNLRPFIADIDAEGPYFRQTSGLVVAALLRHVPV